MTLVETGCSLAEDDGEGYDFLNALALVKADGGATSGRLGAVEMRLPAGFSPPPHVHHREDEVFYLISGFIEAQVGEERFSAQQGAFLWLPRGVQHGFAVTDDGPATILTITTPAGFERFVAEVGTATTSRTLPEPREPDVPRLVEIAGRYGFEFPPPA